MLELDEPIGAFRALEEFLAGEGFYARENVVADLHLGYGLSRALRRGASPDPPEPCPLPLLACRIRPSDTLSLGSSGAFVLGDWQATWDDGGYTLAIGAVRAAIARGAVYQVNLVQHLSASFDGDPWLLLETAWRELPPPRGTVIELSRGDYGAVRGFLYPLAIIGAFTARGEAPA